MIDLLKANMTRAFRGARFYVSVGIMVFVAVTDLILLKYDHQGIGDAFLDGASFMSILVPLVGGMFISRDYTNNTIRNKLVLGHSRTNVYLANLITATAVGFALIAINMVIFLGVGIPLLGWGDADPSRVPMAILLTLLISAVYSAFVTFMCMTLQGISGTVVTFIAIYVINLSLSIVLMFFMDKEWAQYMFDIFPTFQFQQITVVGDDPKHLAMFPVYSCSFIVSFTVCGLYIFRKANVK